MYLTYSTLHKDTDGGDLDYESEELNGVMYFGDYSTWANTYIQFEITLSDGSVEGEWSNSLTHESGPLMGDKVTLCPDAGLYSGKFSGDESGRWTITIENDCTMTGTLTSSEGTSDIWGGGHPTGYVIFSGKDPYGSNIIGGGQIDDGEVSGTWKTQFGGEGTFSTERDDEGGCFIKSVLTR